MFKSSLRSLAAAVLVLAAVAATASAASTVTFTGGKTTLKLSAGAASALDSLGIAVAPVKPASAQAGGIAFPITGGKADAKTLAGKIKHSGGLVFSKGDKSLTVTDFVIDTKQSILTAKAGDSRVTLLDLDLSQAKVKSAGKQLTVRNVKATLAGPAADALNATFDTMAFQEGLNVGTATVKAKVR